MIETIKKLERLLEILNKYASKYSDKELSQKPNPKKWSKKEIIGHLIDSGTHNLHRFTEVQFEKKPYKIRHYNRDKFVIINNYQDAEIQEIIDFFSCLSISG